MTDFERQVDVLLALGVPALAGVPSDAFREQVRPLATFAASAELRYPPAEGRTAFVLVPAMGEISVEALIPKMSLPGHGRPGQLDRNHGEEGLRPYAPVDDLGVLPDTHYLVVDVDRGEEFCGVRPVDALATIADRGRTPLTILEGIALQLVRPVSLQPNKCFMLAGSRRGDKRVPALWISDRAPKLGWCWQGNPHSWLGMASAGGREPV